MKAPAAVALVTGLTLAVVSAVVITGVRSEATNAGTQPAPFTVAVVAAASTGAVVTVPMLSGAGPMLSGVGPMLSGAGPMLSGPAGQSAAASPAGPAAASSLAQRSAAAQASAAAQQVAAAQASAAARSSSAHARAAAKAKQDAVRKAAADQAAARAATEAASSRAAASSVAAASSAAESSSAAAASSSAAASISAAASLAAASNSLAAASRSAAADPAADTSAAVEDAVEQANLAGVTESVLVMNRQTGTVTTSINADAEVPSMSLVKLILAADVIDQAGGLDQVDSDTLAQLQDMIAVSDDSIAQDFYDDGGRSAIITRVAQTYGLVETSPAPNLRYWGDVRVTARDMGSLLFQLLSSSDTGLWFTEAMEAAQDTAADGFNQNFGMNAVPGTGSKQGWGCCLDDVLAIHSVGFTAGQIVIVLSTSAPDSSSSNLNTARQLTNDPGVQAALEAVTRTAAAAVA